MASEKQDEQDDAHGRALGSRESETKRKLARREVGRQRAAVDAGFPHRGESRRGSRLARRRPSSWVTSGWWR